MLSISRSLMNRRCGFTLVELLMVVAIIGVLVTIALPEFAKFRTRAYDATAKSDIMQFRNAIVNVETPAFFWGIETGPSTHSTLSDVTISEGVSIFNISFNFGGDFIFYAIACHKNGEEGYLMVVPYGVSNPFAGWGEANELLQNPAWRWVCP